MPIYSDSQDNSGLLTRINCTPEYRAKYYSIFGRQPDNCIPTPPPTPVPPTPVPPTPVPPARHHHRGRWLPPPPPPRRRWHPRRLPPTPMPVTPAGGELCPQQGWVTRPCGPDQYKVFACTPGEPVRINPALLCPAGGLHGLLALCAEGSGLGDCSDPSIQAKVYQYADQYGIDRSVALAQLKQESGCNPSVCSSQGACGIAQFMPGTWTTYGSGGDRFDIDAALNAWGAYMSHLLSLFKDNYALALAGYHSGEGAAKAALANPAGNPKTVNYVNTIMASAGTVAPDGSLDPSGGSSGGGLSDFLSSPIVWIGGAAALLLLWRR